MPTPTTQDRLLRLDEVAKVLRVEARTVRDWCHEGLVQHIRLPNGHFRIPPEEMQRLQQVAQP